MANFVINHHVNDFDVWKNAYDEHDSTREKFGVKGLLVLQSEADPTNVVVVGEGELDAIHNFLNSEELKNAMKNAGVTGPPDIIIGENKL
ncbi:MAG: DUF3764 family protein [Fidelibacterota bacterium]